MAKKIRIIPWLDKKEFDKQLNDIGKKSKKIKVEIDGSNLNKTTQNMRQLSKETDESISFFGKLKTAISHTFSSGRMAMTSYLLVLNEINKAGKQAKQTITEMDKAVTDLSIAMNTNRNETTEYIKILNKQAIELKTTTKSVTDAADSWLRQGKSMSDTERLIKDSLVLSKVGKIDSASATDYLTSALNGYKLKAEEAISVTDKLTAVDAISASEAGGLALSMSRTASAADLAGVSMDKLIGWLATVKETSRATDETVGNMMKTMLSRMNQVKVGNFIDADSGESLNDMEKTLNKVGIAMRDANGQFISSEIVLDELGKRFHELDSVSQRAVATQLGGAYQYEKVISLLANYSKALEYAEVAENSAGSSMQKFNSSYLDSLEAKQNTLQASFESMIINSDMDEIYSGIIEAALAMVDFVNQTNALKGAFAGLIVAGGIKMFTTLRTGINGAYISLNQFQNALQIVKSTDFLNSNFDNLLILTKNLSASQTKLILSSKNLTIAQREQILVNQGLSIEEAKLQLQSYGLMTAETGLSAATISLGNAFRGLFASMAANPILLITMAVSGAVMAYQSYNQKLEESRRKNIETSETAIEHANSLKDLYNEYTRLSSIQNRTSSEEESFKTVVEDVTKALGAKADILEGITVGTNEYAEALAKATKEELQSASINATIGRRSAEEELQGKVWSDWKGSKVSIDSNSKGKALSDEAQKAIGIVSNALKDFEAVNRTWDNLSWDISSNKPEETLQFYNSLLKAREEIVLASENDEELLNTEIYRDLNSSINTMEESLDSYISKRYEEEKLNYMAQHSIPQTADEYENMKKSILNTVSASDRLKIKFEELLTSDFSNLSIQLDDVAQGMGEMSSEDILSISSTIDQLNTQLKPAFDSLQSAYNDIFTQEDDKELFTLENVDLSMLDSIKSSLDDMGEELKIDVDYSDFENLTKVLTDSSSTSEDVQGAFDSLASSLLNNTDIIGNLDSTTTQLVTSMLESLGVANAEEIVLDSLNAKTEGLALQKEFAALKGLELADAEAYQVVAFLDNAGASETARQYLLKLIYAEQVFNGDDNLSVEGRIKKLNELATAYGDTAIQSLTASAMVNMEHNGNFDVDKALADIQKAVNAVNNVKVQSVGKKSTPKRKKKETDEHLEAYKKELAELEHIHEMGIISDKDYYNRLDGLNKKYFNDSAEHQKKYLSEYQANQEKVYKGLQSLYKELLNDQKDGYDSALSAIDKHFDGEIDKLNELKDASKDSYQSQIDDIDKKIDRLKKERDARKKSIQDQIDAIKEEKEELDRLKALEDAIYDQKRAQTQKSLTYQTVDENGGQAVYKTNSKEITEKADRVDEVLDDIKIAELEKELKSIDEYYDNLISNLESQQDALQEKMDSVTASYEQQIKQMEANQQKYADIVTSQKDAEDKMMATALLGSNWQQLVLSGRLDVLDAFKGNYLGICNEISGADATFGLDASTAADGYAQSISDMLTRTTSLETLLQSWKDLNTGLGGVIGVGGSSAEISTEQGGNTGNGQTASGPNKTPSSGASDTITGAVQGGGDQIADTLANQWVPAWQDVGNNMNDICGGIVSCVNEMASSVVDACAQAIEAINKANAAKDSSSSSNATPSFSSPSYGGKAFAHGTDKTIKGNGSALVNELGEEGLIRNGELHKIHGGAQYMGVKDGDIILNHKQMGELEKNKKVISNGGRGKLVGSFANGTQTNTGVNQEALEALLNDLGKTDENGNIRIKSLENPVLTEQMKNLTKVYNPSDMIMQNFVPKIPDYSNVATERSQEVTIHQDIDVTLPNVTNETGFNKFKNDLNQMKLDAIQRSYRR